MEFVKRDGNPSKEIYIYDGNMSLFTWSSMRTSGTPNM